MKYYDLGTDFGKHKVHVNLAKYRKGNLAVGLVSPDGEFSARITKNIQFYEDILEPGFAFIDTNNCPWAEEFLETNGIAEWTGDVVGSGYCLYPLYKFDMEKLEKEDFE